MGPKANPRGAPLRATLLKLLAALGMLVSAGMAEAAPVRTGHVTAELLSDRTVLAPGGEAYLVLHQAIDPRWHTC
ncbi:MAG: hypothetical protein H6923_08715 [Alphaproteobacteria bacterium]|nr:hypothetical protein [Alphaproteobacteria bacterium]